HFTTVPLNEVLGHGTASERHNRHDIEDRILAAVELLPVHERVAVALFYISGHSQSEVAEFLEVPVGTVKKRLHSARNRLRKMLIDTVAGNFRLRRPSQDDRFASDVVELLQAARAGDAERVKNIL